MLARKLIGAGGGGGGTVTFAGFTIDIAHTTNWVGCFSIRMTDHDDNEFLQGLVGHTTTEALTYANCSTGKFASNSTYGTDFVKAYLNNGSPDISNPTSNPGAPFWSSSNSSGIKIFVKPSIAKSIKYLDICVDRSTYGYPIGSMTLYSGDSASALTPSDSPADSNDTYQSTGLQNAYWYRFTYPTDPT